MLTSKTYYHHHSRFSFMALALQSLSYFRPYRHHGKFKQGTENGGWLMAGREKQYRPLASVLPLQFVFLLASQDLENLLPYLPKIPLHSLFSSSEIYWLYLFSFSFPHESWLILLFQNTERKWIWDVYLDYDNLNSPVSPSGIYS